MNRPCLLAIAFLALAARADEPRSGLDVTVEVPPGTKGTVHVALDMKVEGKDAWAPDGVPLQRAADGKHWRGFVPAKDGSTVEWKLTRGGWDTVEKAEDGGEVKNRSTKVSGVTKVSVKVAHWADEGAAAEGAAQVSSSVVSLGFTKRPVFVWLPPGYEKDASRRYPVIYVLDGQNQFDPKRSFQGVTWGLDTAGEAHVAAGREAFIAVAIDNAREGRADEYLPSRVKGKNGEAGGKLEEFVTFLLEEIKPLVDQKFRTKPGADDTGIMGSSFGGMAAFHIGWKHPDHFRRVAAVSASFWWNKKETKALIEATKEKPPIKLWVDMGTREEPKDAAASEAHIAGGREIRDACLKLGFVEGKDFHYTEDEGAIHHESAWRKRVPVILAFLFP